MARVAETASLRPAWLWAAPGYGHWRPMTMRAGVLGGRPGRYGLVHLPWLRVLAQAPGAVAEQRQGRREQDAADYGGVDQDGSAHADAHDLQLDQRQRGEDREERHHDQRGAGDHAGARGDACDDCLPRRGAPRPELADAAEDEHVVVHA